MKPELQIDPLTHYLHQDDCVWRAITWVLPLEVSIVTGAFLRPGLPGFIITTIGLILVISIWMYGWKAETDRDLNRPIIDHYKPEGFLLAKTVHWCRKARTWFRVQFVTIIILNIFLIVIELCHWNGFWKCFTILFFPTN